MTVNELLEQCQQLQQRNLGTATVIVNFDKSELANGREATTVTVEELIHRTEIGDYCDLYLEESYCFCDQPYQRVIVVNICSGEE